MSQKRKYPSPHHHKVLEILEELRRNFPVDEKHPRVFPVGYSIYSIREPIFRGDYFQPLTRKKLKKCLTEVLEFASQAESSDSFFSNLCCFLLGTLKTNAWDPVIHTLKEQWEKYDVTSTRFAATLPVLADLLRFCKVQLEPEEVKKILACLCCVNCVNNNDEKEEKLCLTIEKLLCSADYSPTCLRKDNAALRFSIPVSSSQPTVSVDVPESRFRSSPMFCAFFDGLQPNQKMEWNLLQASHQKQAQDFVTLIKWLFDPPPKQVKFLIENDLIVAFMTMYRHLVLEKETLDSIFNELKELITVNLTYLDTRYPLKYLVHYVDACRAVGETPFEVSVDTLSGFLHWVVLSGVTSHEDVLDRFQSLAASVDGIQQEEALHTAVIYIVKGCNVLQGLYTQ